MKHQDRFAIALFKLRVIGIRWALYPRFSGSPATTDPRITFIHNRLRAYARRSLR